MWKKLRLYSFGRSLSSRRSPWKSGDVEEVKALFFWTNTTCPSFLLHVPQSAAFTLRPMTCVVLLSLFSLVRFLKSHGWNVQLIKLWLFAARACWREGSHARFVGTWKFKSERRGRSSRKCRAFANTTLWTQFLEDPHQSCIGRAGSDS